MSVDERWGSEISTRTRRKLSNWRARWKFFPEKSTMKRCWKLEQLDFHIVLKSIENFLPTKIVCVFIWAVGSRSPHTGVEVERKRRENERKVFKRFNLVLMAALFSARSRFSTPTPLFPPSFCRSSVRYSSLVERHFSSRCRVVIDDVVMIGSFRVFHSRPSHPRASSSEEKENFCWFSDSFNNFTNFII